jgi:probable rRNA maturation factor
MSRLAFDIRIDDRRWLKIAGLEKRLRKAARRLALHRPKIFQGNAIATVLLTNDAKMVSLNRDFRGLKRPTNVLSFPQFLPRELTKMGKKRRKFQAGDIALGYQYIVKEANKNNKIVLNHATHLVIHGALHLFGYDHQTEQSAARMEHLEKKILEGLGVPDPYVARMKKTNAKHGTPKRPPRRTR